MMNGTKRTVSSRMVLQPIFPRAIWGYSVTGTLLSVLPCWSVSASCRMVLGYLFGWAGTSGYGSGTTAEQVRVGRLLLWRRWRGNGFSS